MSFQEHRKIDMQEYPVIQLNKLCVNFTRWGQSIPAIVDVNLEIYQKEWIVVIGHNGSGKSTLFKVLAGNISPTSGSVNIIMPPKNKYLDETFSSNLFYVTQDPLKSTADELTLLENFIVADPNPNKKN